MTYLYSVSSYKRYIIIYKFLGEDSDQNTCLLWGLNKVDETNIEGYYVVSSSHEQIYRYFAGSLKEKEIITKVGYHFIGENGENKNFGDFRKVGKLEKHGNAVFFSGESIDHGRVIVIHNGDKVKTILDGFKNTRKSKSGKHLLHIAYNFPSDFSTSSLFDLDTMEFIFEGANRFNFNIHFPENDVGTFENEISWEFHEERKGLAKLLGKKVIKHNAVL